MELPKRMRNSLLMTSKMMLLLLLYPKQINFYKFKKPRAKKIKVKFFLQKSGFDSRLGMSIPLLLQNQVPEGFEEEEGPLKVDIRPESSKLEDYNAVPIEQFGLAMLRGMGFQADEGVGKTKQKVNEIKVEVRPKGLGLGAIPVKKKIADVKKNAEDDVLQVRTFILSQENK